MHSMGTLAAFMTLTFPVFAHPDTSKFELSGNKVEKSSAPEENILFDPPPEVDNYEFRDGHVNVVFLGSKNLPRCMSGLNVKICSVIGPVDVRVTFKDDLQSYALTNNQHAICYIGRLGSFCDIYRAEPPVPTKN